MKLRNYEAEWIQRIKASKSKRVLIVGPTGCGKTVVAVSLIREALQRRASVLFLAHRVELINQAKQRLVDHGVPLDVVGTIRGKDTANPRAKVQVASVCTLVRRKKPKADLVFIDEAHHAAAGSYRKILSSYPKAIVFGLTATPYRLDGKPLGDLFEEIVESDKPSKLIGAGWIQRPRVWTVPIEERADISKVKKTGIDLNVGQLEKASNKKKLVGSIVAHWKRLAEGRPTVCYAVSVKHAKRIAAAFRSAGVKSCVIHHETPDDERAAFLRMLKTGELKVLVNCAVLTEGWDCPEARCAIVARATMSQALWMQMGGRVMRPGEQPPIILDHAGNALWHPLPGEDLDFSLETEQRKRGPSVDAKEKTCPACDNRLFLGCRVCPNCGHEFWTGEPPAEVQGELREAIRNDKDICDRYKAGESIISIAKTLKCNSIVISRCLKRNGVRIRSLSESRLGFDLGSVAICERYEAGESAISIAKSLGCNYTTITRFLAKKGITLRSSSEAHLGFVIDVKAIVARYESGESVKLIAKSIGCDFNTIAKYIKRSGLKLRSISESRLGFEMDEKNVISRYKSGESSVSIAKSLGCNHKAITGYLNRNGVAIRSSREAQRRFALDDKAVISDYSDGESASSIAKKYGCSVAVIVSCLKINGVNVRSLREAMLLKSNRAHADS